MYSKVFEQDELGYDSNQAGGETGVETGDGQETGEISEMTVGRTTATAESASVKAASKRAAWCQRRQKNSVGNELGSFLTEWIRHERGGGSR